MAYTINKFGVADIIVEDAELNTTTSLSLVGKDRLGYGEAIAQNSVKLLENFASETAPTDAQAIEGQLWWKPSTNILHIRHTPVVGGVAGTPVWLTIDAGSSLVKILDSDGVTLHNVFVERANGVPVSIASSEAQWTIATSDIHHAFFTDDGSGTTGAATINPGLNLNTKSTSDMSVNTPKLITKQITTGGNTIAGTFEGTWTLVAGAKLQATYADIAELYTSSEEYEPGTLVMINEIDQTTDTDEYGRLLGTPTPEVTQTKHNQDPDIFGIVTTDPAMLMNSAAEGTTVGVALTGRVPCKVTGIIAKGDRIISSDVPGHGKSGSGLDHNWRHVVGRALESKTTLDEGIIEVVVGAK